MNNFIKLLRDENNNVKTFAKAILTLKDSQGFYSRLFVSINEKTSQELDALIEVLRKQNFSDTLDVVMWLET